MFNSELTYQVGLARLDGLRREADDRRLAGLVSRARGRSRSTNELPRDDRSRRGPAILRLRGA
jgi:hypothetical protein